MDHAPPLGQADRPAPLAQRLADSVAEILLQLVDRGSVTTEEVQDLVTAHLVAAPAPHSDLARDLLLQRVLLRLHAHVPARGRG